MIRWIGSRLRLRGRTLLTYGQFLMLFLVVPILVLGVAVRGRLSRQYLLAIIAMSVVALLYTTPWDNAIIAMGVWRYDPALASGIVLGWVPLEEYLFYVLQTILSGLVVLALSGRGTEPT